MDFFDSLPAILEAPIIVLLVIVVLALVWAMVRQVAFLLRIPATVLEAGEKSAAALKITIDELQEALHDERVRLDGAQAEIDVLKQRVEYVDSLRQRAVKERDMWKQKAQDLEKRVSVLEEQIMQLAAQVVELEQRLAA